MWQVCPGLSVVPWQSCTPLKSPGGAPPAPLITMGALVMFVIFTVCCGDTVPVCTSAKLSAFPEMRNCADGDVPGAIPVPCNATLNDCPFQLPMEADEALPVVVGLNVKNMWHVWPTASTIPWQSCTPLKSPGGA